MLQNISNMILFIELITLVVILFKSIKSKLKDITIEKHSMEASFNVPEFINAKIFIYKENNSIAGYSKRSKIYINVFDSNSFENSKTAVHEYVHVWQYRNHRLAYYICTLIESFKYNSSILEKQAYIVEDMYGLCKKTFNWNFDDSIIPVVWESLMNNKWNFETSCEEAYDYCKNNFKPIV